MVNEGKICMDEMIFTSMGKEDMRRDGYGISQKKKTVGEGNFLAKAR